MKCVFIAILALIYLDIAASYFFLPQVARNIKQWSLEQTMKMGRWILSCLVGIYTGVALFAAIGWKSGWLCLVFSAYLVCDTAHIFWKMTKSTN